MEKGGDGNFEFFTNIWMLITSSLILFIVFRKMQNNSRSQLSLQTKIWKINNTLARYQYKNIFAESSLPRGIFDILSQQYLKNCLTHKTGKKLQAHTHILIQRENQVESIKLVKSYIASSQTARSRRQNKNHESNPKVGGRRETNQHKKLSVDYSRNADIKTNNNILIEYTERCKPLRKKVAEDIRNYNKSLIKQQSKTGKESQKINICQKQIIALIMNNTRITDKKEIINLVSKL